MAEPDPTTFNPAGLFFAVLLPGLGHVMSRQVRRGVLAGAGVLGLFFGGILVGGIDVIDYKEDRVWFIGQALVGPLAFGVDYIHQNNFKVIDPETGKRRSAFPDEGRDPATGKAVAGGTPPNRKSIAKMNELGTLAATLAGMLNFIVILDAAFPSTRRGKSASDPKGAAA